MALGPGKYDHLATIARTAADATAVVVIVIDGVNGSGFSVQAPEGFADQLPVLLRSIANQIAADL